MKKYLILCTLVAQSGLIQAEPMYTVKNGTDFRILGNFANNSGKELGFEIDAHSSYSAPLKLRSGELLSAITTSVQVTFVDPLDKTRKFGQADYPGPFYEDDMVFDAQFSLIKQP